MVFLGGVMKNLCLKLALYKIIYQQLYITQILHKIKAPFSQASELTLDEGIFMLV